MILHIFIVFPTVLRMSNNCPFFKKRKFRFPNNICNIFTLISPAPHGILYGTHSRAKWSLGCRFQHLAPRRHYLWNLKCEYLRKERSCGAKTSMANRYYNVCYAESIVFMFHEVLRFIITKNMFLHWRRVAPRRHSVFGRSAKIKT